MTVNYNFKKGVDLANWQWLAPFPGGSSNSGTSIAYDGSRYLYFAVQFGSTTAASTTQLWRYDTWNNGWQFIVALTNSYAGLDIEYDAVRNVIYIINGNTTNTWQTFNLNKTSVTVANQTIAAWTLATMTLVLPATATTGSSLSAPDDLSIPAQIDGGTSDVGGTTTAVKATDATGTFAGGMVGLQVRVTSGAQSGQRRTISAVTDKNNLTVAPALPGALVAGDTFAIELPEDPATAGTTTTLTDSTASWITNQYANSDVIITGGTGAGQRRRIASNTATVLTLSTAVTGNPRTGPFTTAPDATSTYKIVPSSDFLYFQAGGATTLYRLDLVATTGTAWSAALAALPAVSGGGANTFYPYAYAPFQILCLRGSATATIYSYNIGTNAWTTLTTYAGSETFNTGASATAIHGRRKVFVQKEGQTRCYTFNLLTGELEPAGTLPYAAPGTQDGKRAKFIRTPDGVEWMYILRAGGQELFRVPLEWL